MNKILEKIAAYKREEIAAAKKQAPIAELQSIAKASPSVRPFAKTLAERAATGSPALIAEIKKASPSKGLIRADFDPAPPAS